MKKNTMWAPPVSAEGSNAEIGTRKQTSRSELRVHHFKTLGLKVGGQLRQTTQTVTLKGFKDLKPLHKKGTKRKLP